MSMWIKNDKSRKVIIKNQSLTIITKVILFYKSSMNVVQMISQRKLKD